MAFLVDSDVLIEAKDRHYGFDFCPGFWDWLIQQNAAGNLFSVQKIQQELTAGNDPLSVWALKQGANFFLAPDSRTTSSLSRISSIATGMQVNGQSYLPAALSTFLSSGDYYLIAHAHAHGHTVVTHEVGYSGGNQPSLKRLKIPDVCKAAGVSCTNPFDMLRAGGAVLVI